MLIICLIVSLMINASINRTPVEILVFDVRHAKTVLNSKIYKWKSIFFIWACHGTLKSPIPVVSHCSKATSGFGATVKPVQAGFRGKYQTEQAALMEPKVNKKSYILVCAHAQKINCSIFIASTIVFSLITGLGYNKCVCVCHLNISNMF